jgi:hypothetical protein
MAAHRAAIFFLHAGCLKQGALLRFQRYIKGLGRVSIEVAFEEPRFPVFRKRTIRRGGHEQWSDIGVTVSCERATHAYHEEALVQVSGRVALGSAKAGVPGLPSFVGIA